MTAEALVSRHMAAWQAATVHPFLAGVRDGSVPEDAFDRWLAQDYLFARALVRAQSRIAAAAPFADVGLLAGGVVATVGELGWVEEMAAGRGVVLDAPMHPATRAYCDFLLALTYSGYPAQITAIWALEDSASGTATFQNELHRVHPSTSAASSSERGIWRK